MLKSMQLKKSMLDRNVCYLWGQCLQRNGLGGVTASPFYKWNTQSTYINKPPYWEDEYMQMPALKMRPLGVFPR